MLGERESVSALPIIPAAEGELSASSPVDIMMEDTHPIAMSAMNSDDVMLKIHLPRGDISG